VALCPPQAHRGLEKEPRDTWCHEGTQGSGAGERTSTCAGGGAAGGDHDRLEGAFESRQGLGDRRHQLPRATGRRPRRATSQLGRQGLESARGARRFRRRSRRDVGGRDTYDEFSSATTPNGEDRRPDRGDHAFETDRFSGGRRRAHAPQLGPDRRVRSLGTTIHSVRSMWYYLDTN
jgi:hypothetical protein